LYSRTKVLESCKKNVRYLGRYPSCPQSMLPGARNLENTKFTGYRNASKYGFYFNNSPTSIYKLKNLFWWLYRPTAIRQGRERGEGVKGQGDKERMGEEGRKEEGKGKEHDGETIERGLAHWINLTQHPRLLISMQLFTSAFFVALHLMGDCLTFRSHTCLGKLRQIKTDGWIAAAYKPNSCLPEKLCRNAMTHQYTFGNDSRHAMGSFKTYQSRYFMCVTFESTNKWPLVNAAVLKWWSAISVTSQNNVSCVCTWSEFISEWKQLWLRLNGY
jgi:hypothetical protein